MRPDILNRSAIAAVLLFLALILGGCSVSKTLPATTAAPEAISSWSASDCRKARKTIVRTARGRVGCPYRSAGKGPAAFDCSGLTAYAYKAAGISLKPASSQQFAQGKKVGKKALKPGDLVFFGGSRDTKTVSHVGIVVSCNRGNGSFTFIHAANSGVELQKSSSQYYQKRYLGARRILPR